MTKSFKIRLFLAAIWGAIYLWPKMVKELYKNYKIAHIMATAFSKKEDEIFFDELYPDR